MVPPGTHNASAAVRSASVRFASLGTYTSGWTAVWFQRSWPRVSPAAAEGVASDECHSGHGVPSVLKAAQIDIRAVDERHSAALMSISGELRSGAGRGRATAATAS